MTFGSFFEIYEELKYLEQYREEKEELLSIIQLIAEIMKGLKEDRK